MALMLLSKSSLVKACIIKNKIKKRKENKIIKACCQIIKKSLS